MNLPHGSSNTPRRIRQNNLELALRALFQDGRLSRAELARELGLNRSSSGEIIAELTDSGLVRETTEQSAEKPAQSRAGRPGIQLELVSEAALFIGVEIGVEHITTVEVDLMANIQTSRVEPFDGVDSDVELAVHLAIDQAYTDLSKDKKQRCKGIGVSAPAQMNLDGWVGVAPILGWRNVDLRQLVLDALPVSLPVQVENDANAFAFGESYRRPSSERGVTLYMVIETGVGGGIAIDGKLFRGGHGLAGEVGHLPLQNGQKEEAEALLGRGAIVKEYRQLMDNEDLSFEDFLARVRDRAPKSVSLSEDWAKNLAKILTQACRILDPNRIILGGSVAALYPLVEARVAAHIRNLQSDDFPLPMIEVDEAAESGSAYGAACMLHNRFLSAGGAWEPESLTDESELTE